MSRAKLIWLFVNMWRVFPSLAAFLLSSQRDVIKRDLARWQRGTQGKMPIWLQFSSIMLYSPEFRNLFYYRLRKSHLVLSCILKPFLPEMNTLYICTPKIGPGLYIQHGFSTIISAKSIGENCWINQQVTIGYSNDTDCPTIGDEVVINAGAKVIGEVTIGNHSRVGANAVVVKNVPPGCVVAGVPARIIRRDGKRVDELL